MESKSGESLIPKQWEALADMQLRKLDREYQEVLRHEIKIKDANAFKGLRNVLFEDEEEDHKTAYKLESDLQVKAEPDQISEDDGFGDFQESYAEIKSGSDDDDQEEA